MKFSLFLSIACVALAASPVEPLARAYRLKPSTANRAALENFAVQHPRDADGALALLAIAGADVEAQRDPQQAVALLAKIAPTRLAKIPDHLAYFTAAAYYAALNDDAAVAAVAPVFQQTSPKSPLIARAALLAGKAAIRGEQQ